MSETSPGDATTGEHSACTDPNCPPQIRYERHCQCAAGPNCAEFQRLEDARKAATTGQREYRVGWTVTNDGCGLLRQYTSMIKPDLIERARMQTARVSNIAEAWIEVRDCGEWRRLDSPEPSDAERVEAAHQRMHRHPGVIGLRGSDCVGRACPWLSIAYVALNVPDPNSSQTDAGRQS